MPLITLSANFEIVIPEELREKLGLKPGDKLDLYERDGSIRISRHRPITELRGMCKGMKWDDYRDRNDRY
jgi:AbrB family looped-hinge helix DNA binding protein